MFRSFSVLAPSWVSLVAVGLLAAVLFGAGCGGTIETSGTEPIAQGPPPPLATDRGDIYNVSIHTRVGQVPVDKLEVEFNNRRGIHEFYGYFRDEYVRLVRLSFRDLERVDFLGPMPQETFEQAILGNEQMNLQYRHAFEVRIWFRDGTQREFFAIIPKLRGEKDLSLWELGLDNKAMAIDYIEFDR